ncbi:hypothetical protein GCM10025864_11340 [Luteimicrobium album]|uniref:Uncharacterized protein n=1 Tax=Luteimicrobium album TaxID=1054550 RepID=A0ABQ6HY89_9MICO|nr:hypothetical protein GCM10025864_11340 [Luteimicrobium album]
MRVEEGLEGRGDVVGPADGRQGPVEVGPALRVGAEEERARGGDRDGAPRERVHGLERAVDEDPDRVGVVDERDDVPGAR